MPTYTLKNEKTEEVSEVFCSWRELDEMLKDNTDLIQVLSTPLVVSGTGDVRSKVPDGFKDLLKTIKKGSAKNNTVSL